MRQALNLLTLLLISAVILGCTARKQQDKELLIRYRANVEDVLNQQEDARDRASGQSVVKTARSVIGTPYVRGGRNPGGFDCSGLVQWAYQSVGVKLPRTAREQSSIGQRIMRVEDMRAGDIVAFRHPRRGYHTGIYVGDGKFVHSPRRRSAVKISSLDDPYFNNTFLGARRVSMNADGQDLVAQAESRMAQYTEERAVRDMERSRKARQEATAESRKKGKQSSQVSSQRKKKDQVRKPSEQRNKKRETATSRQSGKSKSKAASARKGSSTSKDKARASRQSGKGKEKSASAARQSSKSKATARTSSRQGKKNAGASRASRKGSSSTKK